MLRCALPRRALSGNRRLMFQVRWHYRKRQFNNHLIIIPLRKAAMMRGRRRCERPVHIEP